MKACGLCGESRDTPHSCTVYTAQIVSQSRKRIAHKTYEVSTYYWDIQQHTYSICQQCYITWNIVLPFVVYLILALSIYIVLPDRTVALFCALFPAGYVFWKYIRLPRRLVRKALSQRQRFGEYEYKGFTSDEYEAMRSQRPFG